MGYYYFFIQKYSGDNDYSRERGNNFGNGLRETGATEKPDKVCNIYDMASNYFEWTTETYKDTTYPCVKRGGYYYSQYGHTCFRSYAKISDGYNFYGFRVALYIL